MKKILSLIAILILPLIGCDSEPDVADPHTCHRPADVPEKLITGEVVYWDCLWQESYNCGDFQVIYDENGDPIAVARW